MKFIVIAAAIAFAGAASAQQPPAEYVKRVADAYRAAFAAASGAAKGYITRQDIQGNLLLLPVFESMDINRDGRVTTEELDRFLANLPPNAA